MGKRPWGGDWVRVVGKSKGMRLSDTAIEALRKAHAHGFVVIGKGFGRDGLCGSDTSNVVAAGTWKSLVFGKLLTPNDSGKPFAGEALRVESGRRGYLTPEGRIRVETIIERAPK